MKKFFVQLKYGAEITTPSLSAEEIANDFSVKWLTEPDQEFKMCRIGEVPDEQFLKLKYKFEDTGIYTVFEDISFHIM